MHYIVQPGDTLSGIAARFGTSYQAIASASGVSNPNMIFAGESLVVPTGGSFTSWTPSAAPSSTGSDHEPDGDSDDPVSHTASFSHSSPSSIAPVYHSQSVSNGGGGGGLGSVPGVPSGFASCVAFHESTNGTNQAYNGGVYGIVSASGINVNGQSLSAQKAAFSQLYRQYGTSPWHGDGCA